MKKLQRLGLATLNRLSDEFEISPLENAEFIRWANVRDLSKPNV